MRYEISKDFTFSASHQLAGLPEGHQCARLHGHNYTVRLTLGSDSLLPVGFVKDYGDLAVFKEAVIDALDHRHLNHLFDFNPTAEQIASWLWTQARAVVGVEVIEVAVSETPKTWARYRP